MNNKLVTHTLETAPDESAVLLNTVKSKFGFILNLTGVMASSPAMLEAYLSIASIFETKTDLTDTEQQIVLLTVSRYHECHYCMAAHSMASNMKHVSPGIVEAIRSDRPIADEKLEALRQLVFQLVDKRGWPSDAELEKFYSHGYTPSHLLDVLVGVGQKMLSNFTNHLANTQLDDPFTEHTWEKAVNG